MRRLTPAIARRKQRASRPSTGTATTPRKFSPTTVVPKINPNRNGYSKPKNQKMASGLRIVSAPGRNQIMDRARSTLRQEQIALNNRFTELKNRTSSTTTAGMGKVQVEATRLGVKKIIK